MSSSPPTELRSVPLAPTGIEGLDDILGGGLAANHLYVIEGVPGTGKTTLALQFLMEGIRRGETVLHVSLSETAQELSSIAASHGWSIDGLHIHEVLPKRDSLEAEDQMVAAQHGLIGAEMNTPVDATYLADAVVLLRYFEVRGEIRQAISVLKRRGGAHERTIRELRLDSDGIRLGEPLYELRGVLTGLPVHEGADGPLLRTSE